MIATLIALAYIDQIYSALPDIKKKTPQTWRPKDKTFLVTKSDMNLHEVIYLIR